MFICAGIIIHNLGNCQDIRYIGGFVKFIPLTCLLFNVCNLSLCGLPFLSGFYSKDLIVEFISIGYLNLFVYIIYYISIGLTACYRFRLTYYSLVGEFNLLSLNNLNEDRKIILKRMRGLIFFVVIIGRVFIWVMFPSPYFICLPLLIKFITLLIIFTGVWLGYQISKFNIRYFPLSMKFTGIRNFFAYILNIPFLSTFGVNYLPLFLGKIYFNKFDQG